MIQRFTVYRREIENSDKHEQEHRNSNDEPQYEGVIWSDGTVTLRWLTPLRSTSVWPNIEAALGVHGHPEYGTIIEWYDGPVPDYWNERVRKFERRREPEKRLMFDLPDDDATYDPNHAIEEWARYAKYLEGYLRKYHEISIRKEEFL